MTVMNRNLRVELVSNLATHSCTCLESFPRSLHSQIDDDTYRGLLHIARPIFLPFLASLPTVKVAAMNVERKVNTTGLSRSAGNGAQPPSPNA